jgi:hypothetical protein
MNSPSWMCPSVPQTPVVCDKRISDVSDIRHSDNTNRSCALKSSNIDELVKWRTNNEDDNEPLRRTSSSLICGTGTSLITNFRGCVRSNQLSKWIRRCAQTYGIIPQSFHRSLNHGERRSVRYFALTLLTCSSCGFGGGAKEETCLRF